MVKLSTWATTFHADRLSETAPIAGPCVVNTHSSGRHLILVGLSDVAP